MYRIPSEENPWQCAVSRPEPGFISGPSSPPRDAGNTTRDNPSTTKPLLSNAVASDTRGNSSTPGRSLPPLTKSLALSSSDRETASSLCLTPGQNHQEVPTSPAQVSLEAEDLTTAWKDCPSSRSTYPGPVSPYTRITSREIVFVKAHPSPSPSPPSQLLSGPLAPTPRQSGSLKPEPQVLLASTSTTDARTSTLSAQRTSAYNEPAPLNIHNGNEMDGENGVPGGDRDNIHPSHLQENINKTPDASVSSKSLREADSEVPREHSHNIPEAQPKLEQSMQGELRSPAVLQPARINPSLASELPASHTSSTGTPFQCAESELLTEPSIPASSGCEVVLEVATLTHPTPSTSDAVDLDEPSSVVGQPFIDATFPDKTPETTPPLLLELATSSYRDEDVASIHSLTPRQPDKVRLPDPVGSIPEVEEDSATLEECPNPLLVFPTLVISGSEPTPHDILVENATSSPISPIQPKINPLTSRPQRLSLTIGTPNYKPRSTSEPISPFTGALTLSLSAAIEESDQLEDQAPHSGFETDDEMDGESDGSDDSWDNVRSGISSPAVLSSGRISPEDTIFSPYSTISNSPVTDFHTLSPFSEPGSPTLSDFSDLSVPGGEE